MLFRERREQGSDLARVVRRLDQARLGALIQAYTEKRKTEPQYVFSDSFQAKARELCALAKQNEKRYFYVKRHAFLKTAVAATVLMFCLFATVTVYASVRLVNLRLQEELGYSDLFFDLYYEDEDALPQIIEQIYIPTWVPEGYELQSVTDEMIHYSRCYVNAEGSYLRYHQEILKTEKMRIFAEGLEVERLKINGMEGLFFVNKGTAYLIWSDGSYWFKIGGDSILDKSELVKMLEGMECVKKNFAE